MTCIAGFIDRGVAYIGADSCVSYGEQHRTIQSGRKLVIKGDYLFGLSGEVRFEQAIRSAFNPPRFNAAGDSSERLQDFLISDFAPALRDCVKSFPGLYDASKGHVEADFLLSIHGHLFEIDADFTVSRPDESFLAVGTGMRLALGALHATASSDEPASTRMTRALRAAAYYDKGCAPPFFWGWTDPENPPKILPLALN